LIDEYSFEVTGFDGSKIKTSTIVCKHTNNLKIEIFLCLSDIIKGTLGYGKEKKHTKGIKKRDRVFSRNDTFTK
jgi:hypothetical protein